jgi:hypothetical protein
MQVAVEEGKDHVKDEEHIDGGLELRQEVDAVGDPVQRGTGTRRAGRPTLRTGRIAGERKQTATATYLIGIVNAV